MPSPTRFEFHEKDRPLKVRLTGLHLYIENTTTQEYCRVPLGHLRILLVYAQRLKEGKPAV